MILLGRPSDRTVEEFLSTQLNQGFSYSEVGMTNTAGPAPAGYTLDHNRIRLGEGPDVFDQAVEALRAWQHFNLGWLSVCSTEVPIEPGSLVGLLTSFTAVSLLFACRIVYVVRDEGLVHKYGFAYGTLPGHPECGEERFTLERNVSDNNVWYDILALSYPASLPVTVAYPVTRFVQRRFVEDSQLAMQKAIANQR